MPARGRKFSVIHLMSEAVPFAKTGGLADVGGALPPAQAAAGDRVRVFLPFYRKVRQGDFSLEPTGIELPVEIDNRLVGARIWRCRRGGVDYLFVDQPEFFDRAGLYGEGGQDYRDNILRFGFFCRAAAEVVLQQGWEVDLFHCHDWQAALLPVYLATVYRERERVRRAAVIYTIHNLAYQGLADFTCLPRLHLPPELDDPAVMEFFGRLSPAKGALRFTDYITTVSRTYAREILTTRHGCGLEGILRQRANRIVGVLNGIDLEVWSPRTDELIPARYSAEDLAGKAHCTAALRREMGLEEWPRKPLVAFICRMVEQKGIDLILRALPGMMRREVQVVFLGQGNHTYEDALEKAARRYPGRVGGVIGYSENLAHRVTAGADIFLMPSRFEPCGLNQQYSLRYGAVPVVHRTGGLADTVVSVSGRGGPGRGSTGFVFRRYSARDLLWALDQALALWPDRERWRTLMRAGMTLDLSWARAAKKYRALYRHALEEAAKGERPTLGGPTPGRRSVRWGPGIWMDWGPPLPSRYGREELVLMVQGPSVLYAWWEFPFQSRDREGGVHDGRYEELVLLLEDSDTGRQKYRSAGSDLGDSWILVKPDRRFRVHLALRNDRDELRIVLSSRVVRTPLAGIEPATPANGEKGGGGEAGPETGPGAAPSRPLPPPDRKRAAPLFSVDPPGTEEGGPAVADGVRPPAPRTITVGREAERPRPAAPALPPLSADIPGRERILAGEDLPAPETEPATWEPPSLAGDLQPPWDVGGWREVDHA